MKFLDKTFENSLRKDLLLQKLENLTPQKRKDLYYWLLAGKNQCIESNTGVIAQLIVDGGMFDIKKLIQDILFYNEMRRDELISLVADFNKTHPQRTFKQFFYCIPREIGAQVRTILSC